MDHKEPDASFVEAFARCQGPVFGYIYSLLPHRADADDVFQKTSLVLWKKFDQFDASRGKFQTWACGVAFYEVLEFKRISSRNRMQFDDELMELISDERQADLVNRDARLDQLEDCRGKLSERDKALVSEIYERGLSVVEFAERSGQVAQTLYNRLNLIRRQLYFCLQKVAER